MQLSKNFKLDEFVVSDIAIIRGINNTPNNIQIENLRNLCIDCLQPARDVFNKAIRINSGFRSAELNEALREANYKASPTSQHMSGEAADITAADKKNNKALFDIILKRGVFDQLIWENGDNQNPDWIHVSYRKNRKQILRMLNGSTTHTAYDLTKWTK